MRHPHLDRNAERGTIFTEFLITVPFLLIVIVGIVDLGVTLNTYFNLNRIVYEAGRYAASTPVLEVIRLDTDDITKPAQTRVRNRVRDLIARYYGANPPPYSLTTARLDHNATIAGVGQCSAVTGLTRDQVCIAISTPFVSNFPLLQYVLPTINTEVSGPYLFPN